MPVLTKVEAKSRGGRLFHAGILIALIIGGVTMVYPFLLMLSGSMRSDMDVTEMDLVPDFLVDDAVLVRKFLETKYNYDPILMNRYRQTRDYSFALADIPEKVNRAAAADLRTFVEEADLPDHWQVLGGTVLYQHMESHLLDKFRERVRRRYNDDLGAVSQALGSPLRLWGHLDMAMPRWASYRFAYKRSGVYESYFELMRERPLAERALVNLTGVFLERIIFPEYGMSDVTEYNAEHVRPLASYETFSIPQRAPPESQPVLRKEWLEFVREYCHLSFVRCDATDKDYRQFLEQQVGTIEALRRYWPEDDLQSFDDVALPGEREWVSSSHVRLYGEFLDQREPESLKLVGPEFAWHDWQRTTYGTVAKRNAAYGTDHAGWAARRMPLIHVEMDYVKANRRMLRWRYALRNFKIVLSQIFVQGRPFVNTITYVALALLFSLTVQPLAAYALSRFNPPGTWKFIFIFMATMAFPPMVSTLPMFLMIKELHLLNTFIALVLPVTINGFLIFMLKGFFDSIPSHLYEAAAIEGASELYIFWHISMALSKPILAVVALNTFRMAWMSFMYPLIVCPDESMHVLAVWLHQFQRSAPTSAVFASILVASFPTLLIFLLTQNTIMKGIAVPAEK